MPETKNLEKFPSKLTFFHQSRSYAAARIRLESALFLPAVPAVDGLTLSWLERNFALRTALGADCLAHFAWAAIETASATEAASSSAEAAFVFIHC